MENQLQQKRNKKIELPTVDDVSSFNRYFDTNCEKHYNDLLDNFSAHTWRELASYTLISIQTFNRRRAGEIERATIKDYKNNQSLVENDDPAFYRSLPEDYRKNAERYSRFEIRGKKARGVPVLLSKKLVACLDLILRNRERAGVSPSNPYLFGIPGSSLVPLHLKACELMRRFAEDSGVKNHHLIRGTQLRKQLATQSSILNLDETEVSDLANFLGHADKIHRDHYRMPVVSREIGRVSRLLEMGVQNTSTYVPAERVETITSNEDPTASDAELEVTECTTEFVSNVSEDENSSACTSTSQPRDSWSELGSQTTTYGKKRCVSPIGHVKRRSWSTPEKKSASHLFSSNIELGNLPSLPECIVAIRSYPDLKSRSPAQLKAWVHNEIKKKSNKGDKTSKRVFWSSEEKEIMNKEFKKNLEFSILPSLATCADVRNRHPILQHRNSATIKAWVNNTIRKRS